MANISKELYDNLGKLLRFFRQPFPPGGPGGRRGAENNAQTRVLQFLSASGVAKTTGEIAEKLEIRQQSAFSSSNAPQAIAGAGSAITSACHA